MPVPDLISRYGRTAAGDVRLSVSWHGIYVCAGRADGGVNFARPFSWRIHRQVTASNWRLVLGPFDLMWTRNTSA